MEVNTSCTFRNAQFLLIPKADLGTKLIRQLLLSDVGERVVMRQNAERVCTVYSTFKVVSRVQIFWYIISIYHTYLVLHERKEDEKCRRYDMIALSSER